MTTLVVTLTHNIEEEVLDSVSPSADSVLGNDFLFLAVFFVKAACRTF